LARIRRWPWSRDSFLRGALALAAHVIDEALAVQCRSDHAGGGLERGQLGCVDGPLLAGVVEPTTR